MSNRIWIGIAAHCVSMSAIAMVAYTGNPAWGVLSVASSAVLGWTLGYAREVKP